MSPMFFNKITYHDSSTVCLWEWQSCLSRPTPVTKLHLCQWSRHVTIFLSWYAGGTDHEEEGSSGSLHKWQGEWFSSVAHWFKTNHAPTEWQCGGKCIVKNWAEDDETEGEWSS